jgi:16S rRNA (cytosine1402-N4)-methyltransferase
MIHQPVMLTEVLQALDLQPDGIYIDGTFGRGGHSAAILQKLNHNGRLLCFDKDPDAIASGQQQFGSDPRVTFHHGCFSEILTVVTNLGLQQQINGILLDLGVSSPQLDNAQRGFSFMREGPLDMRMDPTKGMSAKDWLATATPQEISRVLKIYGEEPFANLIAKKIEQQRQISPINTTKELAELVRSCYGSRAHKLAHHPATKTFQGIRIYINQELEAVETALEAGLKVLAPLGRFAIISFHSLEDRLVKRFFRVQSESQIPKEIAIRHEDLVIPFNWIIKRQFPTDAEISQNPRARSATLRALQRNKEEPCRSSSH